MATIVEGLGEGMFDYGAMFKSSGNLTKTETVPASGIKIKGTALKGSAVRVVFPTTAYGTGDQVLIEVQASVDDSTYRTVATYPGGALSWASGHKSVVMPFAVPPGYDYAKLKFTVSGGTTTDGCNFGAVFAGIVPQVHGNWHRNVDWS